MEPMEAQKLTLEIHYTGLCALVPDPKTGHEATILFVDARRSQHGAHHALLLAEPDRIEAAPNRLCSTVYYQLYSPELIEAKLCVLDHEDFVVTALDDRGVRVELARNSLQLVTGLRRPSDNPCPDGTSAPDISWVNQIAGTLRPELLNLPYPPDLIARMKLTEGTLRAGGFRAVDSRGLVRWRYGAGPVSALAEEVVYELELPENIAKVVLESTTFGGGAPSRDIVLIPDPEDRFIQIWIVNMRLEDLLTLEAPRPLDPDSHFEEYYRLCQGSPTKIIPRPELYSFCDPFEAPSNPKCPPTLFTSVGTSTETQVEEHEHHSPFSHREDALV